MVFGYNRDFFLRYNVTICINLEISVYSNVLITGCSGSGKTQALLFLIGKLLQDNPDIKTYVCDFKNSEDFSFLKGYPNYYAGDACYNGILDYYTVFTAARQEGGNQTRYLLICDEYPALINYLQTKDKINKTKNANDILGAVAEILMLGRGIGFGIWIVTQRAESTLFANGTRDNCMVVIGMGRLSKEQKSMIFAGQEIPDEIFTAGEGMLLADGHEIVAVKYPLIQDMADWKRHILRILTSGGKG